MVSELRTDQEEPVVKQLLEPGQARVMRTRLLNSCPAGRGAECRWESPSSFLTLSRELSVSV